MSFYLDFLLDVTELRCSLAYPVAVSGYEVAAVYFAVPKTFDATTEFVRLQANFISTQPFFDWHNLLFTAPVHDTLCMLNKRHHHQYSLWKSFIYEPINTQYRPILSGPLTDIAFTILDQNNKSITFEEGKVLVVLNFRPKY